MAKKQILIHLHGNTPFNAPTSIEKGELVIEHGSGAKNVKMHTRSEDDKLATFITETAIDDKINVVNENITTLSGAVATLNGEETVAGSVKKALKDAKEYTDEVIAELDLANTYEAKGAAADALTDAKEYAESQAGQAQTNAEKTATDLNTAMNIRVEALEAIDHEHANMAVLNGITGEKVAAWDAAEQNAKDHADGLITTLSGDVITLQGEVNGINDKIGSGFDEENTVTKAVAAAKTTVSAASESAIKVTLIAEEDGHSNYELSLEGIASSSELTTLSGKVETLIDSDEGKSVRTIANEELAAQLLSGEADADFKTLKELAAWLEAHPESVATINENIASLSGDVKTAQSDITTLSGAVATLNGEETVAGSVKKALADAKEYADGLDTAMSTRVEILEAIDHDAYKDADTALETNITNTINSMKITLPSGDISLINNKFDLSTMTIDCGTY